MADPKDLAQCPLMEGLPRPVLKGLALVFQQRSLRAGETLFVQDDPADCLVVVHSGTLREEHPDRAPRLLSSGEFLGVPSLLEPQLHPGHVKALEDTSISTLNRQDLDRLWRKNPGDAALFHLAITDLLITFLHRANERLVRLCELPLDHLDEDGLRQALQVIDDALHDGNSQDLSGPTPS